jgi:phosphopantetheinyl transferase
MPLVYQQNNPECAQVAVWDIVSDETLPVADASRMRAIHHPAKLRQHQGARRALQQIYPCIDFSQIVYTASGRPHLPASNHRFSVSHAGDRVGAIYSSSLEVGMDLEWVSAKALRLSPKFLTESDWDILRQLPGVHPPEVLATLGWCVKESLFKWYSLGKVDFKDHLVLHGVNASRASCGIITAEVKLLSLPRILSISFQRLDACWLSWIAAPHPGLWRMEF